MPAARIEPERLDEGDLSFRLAPRINAAGRLYRADAGVELMLTDDEDRAELRSQPSWTARTTSAARPSARSLDARRDGPEASCRPRHADAAGLVIAGEGWHPGVVGICASRMVERTGRPVLLLAIDEGGRARGSGRSVPGYDLLAGLRACSEHLERFGGHRAAAGLELAAERIPALRDGLRGPRAGGARRRASRARSSGSTPWWAPTSWGSTSRGSSDGSRRSARATRRCA